MPHDIDIVSERLREAFPDLKIAQLQVSHRGVDDDGLWFFSRESKSETIQVESSTYCVPFLVEWADGRMTVNTIDDTVEIISRFFSNQAK
jgi:hypothetical protein